MSAALEAVAASQGGPFTARQAWEVAGYSKGFIRHRVWSGRWIVLRRGIYVDRTALEARGESDGRRHAISVAAALLAFAFESIARVVFAEQRLPPAADAGAHHRRGGDRGPR